MTTTPTQGMSEAEVLAHLKSSILSRLKTPITKGGYQRGSDNHRADFAVLSTIESKFAELARLRAEVEGLRKAGGRLSNIAFNLSQSSNLDQRTRDCLRETCQAWDAALSQPVASRADGGA